jgi:DNA-binding NtrC family response regulator
MENKKLILAVDDNAMQLEIYNKILASDYDVRTVDSAADALSFLNTNGEADVILLDIAMPNVSGFDFLHDVRKIPSYSTVPIIIVSGKSGTDFYNEAKRSGAFEVLGKPVKSEELLATIKKAI